MKIRNKAYELGQKYFPNANNVWARANIEAQYVSSACTEMAEWMQKQMIERLRNKLQEYVYDRYFEIHEDYIEDFCKELMED